MSVLFFGSGAVVGQEKEEALRITSGFVHVPVSILDRDGRYVQGLRQDQFRLFEDGIEQEISHFEPTDAPFTVLLLADVSGSMTEYMPSLGRAIDSFINQLRPNDTLAVAFFSSDSNIDIRIPPVKKKDYRYIAAKPIKNGGGGVSFTMTLDAVDHAIKYMRGFSGRRAIILFGDGDQSGRRATFESNLRDAEEQEAIIYTIQYGDYPAACIEDNVNYAVQSLNNDIDDKESITKRDLRQIGSQGCYYRKKEIPKLIKRVEAHFGGLASRTGGRAFKIKEISDLNSSFATIVAELGQQYTIGYEPKDPSEKGETRKISVKVSIPNVAIRSRKEVVYNRSKK